MKGDCAAKGFVGMFRRACPGPPFGWCQGNVRFPSPPTLFPLPYDSHFPPQTHKWSMRFPTSRPVSRSLPVARRQGTSPHRPAPSAKAGVSKRFNPYAFAGNLRSVRTDCLTLLLLADGLMGSGRRARAHEQITHTPLVQLRGYWMASEAKGKPGHQPIGFRCG